MTILSTFGAGGDSSVDTGDIGHSLRFRSGSSAYLSKTFGSAADRRTYTISFWFKRSRANNTIENVFTTSNDTIRFNDDAPGDQLRFVLAGATLRPARQFRDPTAWNHCVLAVDTTQATDTNRVKIYIRGEQETSFTAVAYPALNADGDFGNNVAHAIGALVGPSQHLDGYLSRFCLVGGSQLTPSSFGQLNTEINEWVSKSQSAVKAVVDAGGTNSFMLDFDDATSLTTLGYDKSSKGNNWTLNNFSLTAGTTYDHMLDVPGNSFATLNNIYPSAANITNGNLTSGTTAVRATMNALVYNSKWEVTAGGSAVTAGVISSTGTTNTTSVTANKVFAFRLTTAGALDYRNVTDAGSWTSITTGLSGEQYPYGVTQAANWNFGQAPLHASATYQSAEGGYFYDTTAGFKALCQRNMPDPAILNPKNGFVSVLATEDNIYSTLASARSGWTDYVDILKNRAASESWAWQFSHDSSNEYAVAASSLVRQTKRTQSGSNNWVGYSIRIGATYGTAAGSVSHTNGVATTITHNVGKSARQLILLFNRAGGSAVPVYHPDLTSGELVNLCSGDADAASTAITSVGTNSFQIGSATASGTYDYLVCSEISQFCKVFSYTGNANADGPYIDTNLKCGQVLFKNVSAAGSNWLVFDSVRDTFNLAQNKVGMNAANSENDVAICASSENNIDMTALAIKARTGNAQNNGSGNTIVGIAFADVSGKFALGR